MLIKHNLIGIKFISLFISGRSCIPSSHNPRRPERKQEVSRCYANTLHLCALIVKEKIISNLKIKCFYLFYFIQCLRSYSVHTTDICQRKKGGYLFIVDITI